MKALLGIDKGADADVLFLKHVCGEGGASALQATFERTCLRLEDGSRSIADAVECADKIVKSDLFGALTTEKQAQMKSAVAVLRSLKSNQRPASISSGTEWLKGVWVKVAKYFKHERVEDSTQGASTIAVYGKEAMHEYITSLTQKGKSATAEEIAFIEHWSAWIDSDKLAELATVKKKQQEKSKAEGKKKAAAKPKAVAEGKKVSTAEIDAEQAVLAMLRRKKT
eukprot:6490887-Amphidinium_carterae.1